MQDVDSGGIRAVSKINCLKPCVIVRESISISLRLVMSFNHHVDNLALKSAIITVNRDFETSTLLSISSKPKMKDSKQILLWLGDLYITEFGLMAHDS